MVPRLIGCATAGALLASAMPAASQTIPPVADMRAKVEAFVRASYPAADIARVHVEYADINSDGVPEAFAIVVDEKACGVDPCALVLGISDTRAEEIAVLAGQEIRALQTKNGKWRDIMLDGKRLRWQEGVYK